MNKPSIHRDLVRKSLAASGLAIIVGGLAAPLAASAADDVQLCLPTHLYAKKDGDVVNGTCGDDIIKVGGYKNVTVFGNGGNDDVRGGYASSGTLTVHLGSGNDEFSSGTYQTLVVFGDAGNDDITGGSKADHLDGGSGNDHIESAGGSADVVAGGIGDDTAWLDQSDTVSGIEHKQF